MINVHLLCALLYVFTIRKKQRQVSCVGDPGFTIIYCHHTVLLSHSPRVGAYLTDSITKNLKCLSFQELHNV